MLTIKTLRFPFVTAFLFCSIMASAQQMNRDRFNQNNTEVRFFARDNYRGDQSRQNEGNYRSIYKLDV
ncbi:hypothetical protein GCM10028807_48850 [Spirosoma daeguense]